MKLSVLIPVYNEESTVQTVLQEILNVELKGNLNKQIIIVNDASTDNTDDKILEFKSHHPDVEITYVKHEKNQGKGRALRTGIQHATGDFLIIQDADLEYDPHEFNILLKPMLNGIADVVYGSRFVSQGAHRILFFWHYIGNQFLTLLSNMFTNLNLTDMETCYKLFKTDIIKTIPIREKGFGFEPEITAKISKIKRIRIYEVGISYYGRTYEEGKKINWKDGFRALYCIIFYNLFYRVKK